MAVHLNILSKANLNGIGAAQKEIKNLGSSLKSLAGAVGLGVGLSALTSGLMAAGKAAAEDTKSSALLANQLRNSVNASDEQVAGIERAIKALQLQTSIADDELRPALSQLVSSTGSMTQAQRLLAISTDLAAAKGKDLGTVSTAVAKAAAGQTTALFKLAPELKKSADWATAAEEAYAGMAETAARNDPYQRLNIIFGELQEQIGMALLPQLNQFADYLASTDGQQNIAMIADGFADVITALGQVTTFLVQNGALVSGLTITVGLLVGAWGLVSAAVAIYTFATLGAVAATTALKAALLSTGVGAILVGLGAIAGAFASTGNEAEDAKNKVEAFNNAAANPKSIPASPTNESNRPKGKLKPGYQEEFLGKDDEWYKRVWDGKKWIVSKLVYNVPGGNKPAGTKPKAVDPIKAFYSGVQEEIKKQNASIRLSTLGASDALIEAVIGSGEKWETVYRSVINGGKSALTALESQIKASTAFEELRKVQAEVEAAAEETRQKQKADAAAVTGFYEGIADEVAKQAAKITLMGMGASEGLIGTILGSSDWKVIFADVQKNGVAALTALQGQFNKTAQGADELANKTAEAAAKAKELADAAQEFENLKIANLKAINSALDTIRTLGVVEKDLGKFESAAVTAFGNVEESLKAAFDDKVITESFYNELKAYAASESRVLQSIGRQRDELAAKKSLVESVMSDVTSAVKGLANINSFIKSESETVTTATTQMLNGIRVTTTRTLEVLKTQNDIVGGFQGVLDKTKKFVANLKQLRALGLSSDLFKQIVDAGVDAGSATAEALIGGGAGTIKEVNDLYKEISDVAGQAAEETAQVLYGQGIDLVNGIMAGIAAQESALVTQAKNLGDAFAAAFTARVTAAMAATEIDKPIWEPELKMTPEPSGNTAGTGTGGSAVIITNPTAGMVSDTITGGLGTRYGRGLMTMASYDPTGFNAASGASLTVGGATSNIITQPVVLKLDSKTVAEGLIKLQKTNGQIWAVA